MKISLLNKLSTVQTITLGFLSVILLGSILLTLPISSASGEFTNYIDALFTSTTSVCVTGLVTVNTMVHWSWFGKIIILGLIQVGGLGFMTAISMVITLLRKKISIKNRLTVQDSLNETSIDGIRITVKKVVFGTILIESIGAVFITIALFRNYSFMTSLKYGIFTSISAFCNAGIDIMSMDSLVSFNQNYLLLWTVMILIVVGGIGFPIWWEFLSIIKRSFSRNRNNRKKLSLHFKLVIITTIILIVGGAIIIFLSEYGNDDTIGNMGLADKVNNAIFQSVTTRTAGFASVDQVKLTTTSRFISMFMMFIGGSPGSTAGGVKTVTFVTIIIMLISWVQGKEDAKIFNRKIPDNIVKRAFLIVELAMMVLFISIFILLNTENGSMSNITFECISALATVGLSLNFTANLTMIGKIVIIILMFMGRIGPITLFLAVNKDKKQVKVKYPEEKILIG